MAKSYFYRYNPAKDNFKIMERETDQLFATIKEKAKAIKYCKFLNSGGCFAGFTPAFFLIKT